MWRPAVACMLVALALASWVTLAAEVDPTAEARAYHSATALTDGRVLVVGGQNDYSTPVPAEIWDPATGTFGPTDPMTEERVDHTATALPDGRVLVMGGTIDHSSLASAEVWEQGDG